jgi:uncharacterized membrane protein
MPPDATPETILRRRWPRILRIVRARPRLFVAVLIGAIVAVALRGMPSLAERLLVSWDVTVLLYLVAAFQLITTGTDTSLRHRAEIEDEGRIGVLVLTVAAAFASLGAIVILLVSTHGDPRSAWRLGLATGTNLLSWAFINTIFAFHYAHEYYGVRAGKTTALKFPNDAAPDYWDFVYFSFVIGMTSQVSDVAISSKPIRRTVAAHAIITFLFNTALLALMVNIAASAMASP